MRLKTLSENNSAPNARDIAIEWMENILNDYADIKSYESDDGRYYYFDMVLPSGKWRTVASINDMGHLFDLGFKDPDLNDKILVQLMKIGAPMTEKIRLHLSDPQEMSDVEIEVRKHMENLIDGIIISKSQK